MYGIDRSPGNDATLGRVEFARHKDRRGTIYRARFLRSFGAGRQVPAVNPHVRPGHGGLSEDCHKSPRSLPVCAPGIPSSARDHSLAPWLTTRFAWEVPRLRGIQTHAPSFLLHAHGPIIPAPEHQVLQQVKRKKEKGNSSKFDSGLRFDPRSRSGTSFGLKRKIWNRRWTQSVPRKRTSSYQ
jgi:hypothetical protein